MKTDRGFNPFFYLLCRLSLWVFPTFTALSYVERGDAWRAARTPRRTT